LLIEGITDFSVHQEIEGHIRDGRVRVMTRTRVDSSHIFLMTRTRLELGNWVMLTRLCDSSHSLEKKFSFALIKKSQFIKLNLL